MKSLLIVVTMLLALALCSFAEVDSPTAQHEKAAETVYYPTPTDVKVVALFPRSPTYELVVGERAEVILGFANKGEDSYTITHIAASIRHPLDFRYSIQNFSRFDYFVTVDPAEELSLSYLFTPSELLEPREFGLTVAVAFFDDAGRNYTTAFFNRTVEFIEPRSSFDVQTFFTYIFALAIGGLAVFGFFKFTANLAEKKQRKRKFETGTVNRQEELGDEWLEGTSAEKFKKKPQKGQKPKNK